MVRTVRDGIETNKTWWCSTEEDGGQDDGSIIPHLARDSYCSDSAEAAGRRGTKEDGPETADCVFQSMA